MATSLNPPPQNPANQKRPSFLLSLLILILILTLCLLLGGAIAFALLALMHLLHIPGQVSLAPAILILGIFGIGVTSFNFLAKKFPTKIGLSK